MDAMLEFEELKPEPVVLWKTAMANQEQFAAKATELAALPPRVKTEGKTEGLAKREGTPMANAKDRRASYNIEMARLESQGLSHDAAHREFERTHPNYWGQ